MPDSYGKILKGDTGDVEYKEVVVVGNGPSGIVLSYVLSGNLPYYNGEAHPDEMLTRRLRSIDRDKSLLEQDLQFLSMGLMGRSLNPISNLVDQMMRPHDDQYLEKYNDNGTLLDWRYQPEYAVDHVVIGKGAPGGSWHAFGEDILTISVSPWMELPGLKLRDWVIRKEEEEEGPVVVESARDHSLHKREMAKNVAKYYQHYVDAVKLAKNFRNYSFVTSVRPIKNSHRYKHPASNTELSASPLWKVKGFDTENNTRFKYICKSLVLAVGTCDAHKYLRIPGELNHDWIVHALTDFKKKLKCATPPPPQSGCRNPILVVGSGLSAADAVIAAEKRGYDVLHIFSTASHLKDFREDTHAEYAKVFALMTGGKKEDFYEGAPQCQVLEMRERKGMKRVKLTGDVWRNVTMVAVMTGHRPEFGFLPPEYEDGNKLGYRPNEAVDNRKNPVLINPWNYTVVNATPGLYAMGPLVGDNFVRIISGGAVGIANNLLKERTQK